MDQYSEGSNKIVPSIRDGTCDKDMGDFIILASLILVLDKSFLMYFY